MPFKGVSVVSFITPPFKIQDVIAAAALRVRLVVAIREECSDG
jgi:hypothetical protein